MLLEDDMRIWEIQEAKARLSELITKSETEGPQDIAINGKSVAVLISRHSFDRMTGRSLNLLEFMRNSPLYGNEDLNFERDKSLTRNF